MTSDRHPNQAAQRRAELAASRAHEDDVVRSTRGRGEAFADIFQRRIDRRGLLKAGAAAVAVVLAPSVVSGEAATPGRIRGVRPSPGIKFQPLAPQPATAASVKVAEGHDQGVLLAWGDAVVPGSPEWDPLNQSEAAQEMQFGYNCDYIGWHVIPVGSGQGERGLLWVNHEYTNEELMFVDYDPENPTQNEVDVAIAAHGGSIVELRRDADGRMRVEPGSEYNRRITGTTPMRISGPAAGHEWLKTGTDPSGTMVNGTLNNCAGGITPWGTVLTAEENFHQYFSHVDEMSDDDERKSVHERYGLPGGSSDRRWERYHGRFSCADVPNESFRFGWVVEIDPMNPDSTPVKRTALGRFRHEGATWGSSPSGRVVFYSGDDARFEYMYKYVSDEAWDPLKRGMGQSVLDEGVLYVAKLNDDGTGEWLPLIYGEGPLTEEHEFTSQGDVLVKTRLAADLLGATKMDRPEDMQQNPVNKKVYVALTNNTRRTEEDIDPANPRADNVNGHILEITEDKDDAVSESFSWEIFILCGDPEDGSTYFAGFPKEAVSPVANPDNVNFDAAGNLWISTDGQPRSLEQADGLYVVPMEGPERGNLQGFLSVVAGAECASFEFVNDYRNMFVSVQHPAEGTDLNHPELLDPEDIPVPGPGEAQWPDGGYFPRPAVIQVWANNGGRIGES